MVHLVLTQTITFSLRLNLFHPDYTLDLTEFHYFNYYLFDFQGLNYALK